MRSQAKKSAIYSGVLLALLMPLSCGKTSDDKKDDEEDAGVYSSGGSGSTTTSIASDVPGDSTGQMGTTSLGFGLVDVSQALALADANTLSVGSDIVLTDARVNIGVIKLKSDVKRSAAEKALISQRKADEEARKKELESQQKTIEADKEALEKAYSEAKDAATTDAERATLKTKFLSDLAAIEARKAELHSAKEQAEADKEASQDGNVRWKGPYVYDLVSGAVTPSIADITIPDGSYRRIEFKLRPNRTLEAGDALLNNSVYLAGSVTIQGVAVPFTVSLGSSEQVLMYGSSAFKVEAGVQNALLLGFTPQTWFEGVEFASATKDAEGTIVISSGANTSLLEKIKNNIKEKSQFGKDQDGDGKVKAAESSGDGKEGAVVVSQEG